MLLAEQASSSLRSALQAAIREQVAEALLPANIATAAVASLAVLQVPATVAAQLTATVDAAPAVLHILPLALASDTGGGTSHFAVPAFHLRDHQLCSM